MQVNPYTLNATRTVTDLSVEGSVGDYPVKFSRTLNTRSDTVVGPDSNDYNILEFRAWSGSYDWSIRPVFALNQSNYRYPIGFEVYFPDGRSLTFPNKRQVVPAFANPGDPLPTPPTNFDNPNAVAVPYTNTYGELILNPKRGVKERMVVEEILTNENVGQTKAKKFWILLPDGGAVEGICLFAPAFVQNGNKYLDRFRTDVTFPGESSPTPHSKYLRCLTKIVAIYDAKGNRTSIKSKMQPNLASYYNAKQVVDAGGDYLDQPNYIQAPTEIRDATGRGININYRDSDPLLGYPLQRLSVVATNGRQVTFQYQGFDVPISGTSSVQHWELLSRVNYQDAGSRPAIYTYVSGNTTNAINLLPDVIDDPRYEGAPKRVKFTYQTGPRPSGYPAALTWPNFGAVKSVSFSHPTTGEVIPLAQFTPVYTPLRQVIEQRADGPSGTFSDGPIKTYTYKGTNATDGFYLLKATDFRGNVSEFGYDSNGYLNYTKDADGKEVWLVNEQNAGALLKTTYPPNALGSQPYREIGYSSQKYPYFAASSRDERGNITYTDRLTSRLSVTNGGPLPAMADFPDAIVSQIRYPDGSSEAWSGHNSFGQPTQHRRKNGFTETYVIDASGRATEYHAPGSSDYISFEYDAMDRLWKTRDRRGLTTTYLYTTEGRPTDVLFHDGTSLKYTYDFQEVPARPWPNGNITSFRDEKLQVWQTGFDEYDRAVTITDPLNRVTTVNFDSMSGYYLRRTSTVPRWRLSPGGRFDVNEFDNDYRLTATYLSAFQPDFSVVSMGYSANGQLAWKREGVGPTSPGVQTDYGYDNRNRIVTVTTTSTSSPGGLSVYVQRTDYDDASNVIKSTAPDNTFVLWENFDELNRSRRFVNARAEATNRTFWPSGNVKDITDPNLKVHSFAYDAEDRMIQHSFPDGTNESWTYLQGLPRTYRPRGGLMEQTFDVYDNRNRLTNVSWNAGAGISPITYTYDDCGRVTGVTNANSIVTREYDVAGQLTAEVQNIGASGVARIEYAYDADGILRQTRHPELYNSGGTLTPSLYIRRDYNSRDQLYRIGVSTTADPTFGTIANPLAEFGYNSPQVRTALTSASFSNGVNTSFLHDERGRIIESHTQRAGATLSRRTYGYDLRDRMIWFRKAPVAGYNTENGNGQYYQYDNEGQLSAATHEATLNEWYNPTPPSSGSGFPIGPSSPFLTYEQFYYDGAGNRTRLGNPAGVYTPPTYVLKPNGDNQYATYTEGYQSPVATVPTSTFQYDTRGNVVDFAGFTANYDAEGRIIYGASASTGFNITFTYDGLGRCVKRVITDPASRSQGAQTVMHRFYDGWSLIATETLPPNGRASALARVVYGFGATDPIAYYDRNILKKFFHYDARGSVILTTDAAGAISARHEYQAYGLPNYVEAGQYSVVNNQYLDTTVYDRTPFLFKGYEYIRELGLYDLRNRVYDPVHGRFLQPDPSGFDSGDGNFYRYCLNDPINGSDHYGLQVQIGAPLGGGYNPQDLANATTSSGTSWVSSGVSFGAGLQVGFLDFFRDVATDIARLQTYNPANILGVWQRQQIAALEAYGQRASESLYAQLNNAGIETSSAAFINGHSAGYVAGTIVSMGRSAPSQIGGFARAAAAKITGAFSKLAARFRGTPSIPGLCFIAGTEIETERGSVAIESLSVGDRVLTTDGDSHTEVDPATWKRIRLRMSNPESPSDVLDLELLRSADWMAATGCQPGEQMWLELEEMSLRGWANVQSVGECPEIRAGRGRVVLATVAHYNTFVMEVRLEGQEEPLRPTDRHRLFSVTRNNWVPTASLLPGEQLRTDTGTVRIASVQSHPGKHRVFNIEVETEHSYFAGKARVLSHNANPCAQLPGLPPPNLTPPGAGRTGALHEALRRNGVPTSQQPSRVLPNLDRRGNVQPGRVYEYDVPAPGGGTRTVRIRDDAGGHNFGPGDRQNRGPHFNDQADGHYDY
ncbi:MAG: Hint domain-containing protein [Verrucomicrobia bacterium]|nr:Hint domain-containing protein [Verrucomicrobiota bacterium]